MVTNDRARAHSKCLALRSEVEPHIDRPIIYWTQAIHDGVSDNGSVWKGYD